MKLNFLMRVCLVNTSDSGGGAPVACRRLLDALEQKRSISMLVRDKGTAHPKIFSVVKSWLQKQVSALNFLSERVPFILFNARDKQHRFAFSTANFGTDISNHPNIQEADIIHLHWTNKGFLSIHNIHQLLATNKAIVWTLHDMWTFTGGCHYTGDCLGFKGACGKCPLLKNPHEKDLSKQGWVAKSKLYQAKNMVFVACSKWMAEKALSSSLLMNAKVVHIPNPIAVNLYKPQSQSILKDKFGILPNHKVILFGAANINDTRKGIRYLTAALDVLKYQFNVQQVQIVVFGKNKSFDVHSFPYPVINFPLIKSEVDLIELYNLADVFVLPSLEDNLPNMVMEAMSCGIPVVAFDQGGLPEMIDHQQNGYLAKLKSPEDFAEGIKWVFENGGEEMKKLARKKVVENYSEEIIAKQYDTLYQSILN